jgi:hypothetical protein
MLEDTGSHTRSTRRKAVQALAIHLLPEDFTVAVEETSLSSDAFTADRAENACPGNAREAGSHSSTETPDIASSSKAESRKDSRGVFEPGYQAESARPTDWSAKNAEYCTDIIRALGRRILTAAER